MNKERSLLKGTALLVAFLGCLVSLGLLFNSKIGLCGAYDITCSWKIGGYGAVLIIFIPIFVFSLVTFFMKREVHKAWAIFSGAWAVITILAMHFLVLGGSGGGIGVYADPTPGIVAIGLFGLYPIISICIIVWKYWRLRGSK